MEKIYFNVKIGSPNRNKRIIFSISYLSEKEGRERVSVIFSQGG